MVQHIGGVEYVLKEGETIVSKTDLRGNITYVNQDFIRISGYSEMELIGAPQNIVRHSDMPKEAFYDFWQTLKSGKAWTGLVKNRCKNGDFYWVEAHASPIVSNGQVVGYTSVRVRPSRDDVRAAQSAYDRIRSGDKRITIREGEVVKPPKLGSNPQKPITEMSIRMRLLIWTLFMAAMFLGNTAVAWMVTSGFIADAETAQNLVRISQFSMTGSAIIALLGGAALYAKVITPLRDAQRVIDRMAGGDLSGRIDAHGNNEISGLMQSLRKLQINVKLLVGQIKESASDVSDQAFHFAQVNAELAQRTQAQAASVQQTSVAAEQLSGAVSTHAQSTQEANSIVERTANSARGGAQAAGQMTQMMTQLQEGAQKIGAITSTINSIAFQTNILALNAAVEAARAGQQGRGFAVVASEVRNLAQRSSEAAKDIKSLIDTSVAQIQTANSQVHQTEQIMQEILSNSSRAAHIMSEVSAACQDQLSGIVQISEAIAQIQVITHNNAQATTDSARTASELDAQVDKLNDLVGAFSLVN